MSDLTRIDTYLTTSLQAVTFYRGTRKPHTVLDPTVSSALRLTHQVVELLHNLVREAQDAREGGVQDGVRGSSAAVERDGL